MSPVGAVFTPGPWARWAVDQLDAPARVAGGASFCDPTAGEGAFAFALAEAWAGTTGTFDPAWARRITLVDRESSFLEVFARRWRERWNAPFPERNLVQTDVVTAPPPGPFDLVAGNPPWVTYPELAPEDKDRYRPRFASLGLVGRPGDLLLGRSRLDLAALVTARVLGTLVAPGGRAGFFLPLSLFHNEGAPGLWRHRWRPAAVYDLTDCRPFPGVSTRCGWAEFAPDRPPAADAPVPYHTGTPSRWTTHHAVTDSPGGPLRLLVPGASTALPRLTIEPWQRPRQGINTGGANAAFHVTGAPPGVDRAFIHPLAVRPGRPDRSILVPYDRQGQLLDAGALERSGLAAHWSPWKDRLAARKGILLGAQLSRGHWWALLGVGPYAFTEYKVIWDAYGRDRLDARVLGPREDGAVWQADQALQAYIPCRTLDDAGRIAGVLNGSEVADYLAGLRGAGTRNWAQPGRFTALWQPPTLMETGCHSPKPPL